MGRLLPRQTFSEVEKLFVTIAKQNEKRQGTKELKRLKNIHLFTLHIGAPILYLVSS